MSSEKFRRQLRQESEQWRSEGLIESDLYDRLAERYQFSQLETEASHRFIAILMGLGAILLGLGAITFVAANWQVWSRSLKMVLLISTFIGVNATGFYLWRKPMNQPGYQRLGAGLLIMGALLLGANLGLMSQMFHQSGDLYELFVIWGLGVALMAYSLRLTVLGAIALILVMLAYCFSWGSADTWLVFSGTTLVMQHLPLVVSLIFVPLAYWCRSRVIFGLSGIAIAVSYFFNFHVYQILNHGWLIALGLLLPTVTLWAYSDRIWQRWLPLPSRTDENRDDADERRDRFQPIAQTLALWSFSILLYVFSFRTWWEFRNSGYQFGEWNTTILIDAALLGIIAVLGWVELRYELFSRRSLPKVVNSRSMGGLFLVSAVALIGSPQVAMLPVLVFNGVLFSLAILLIWDGLALTQRSTFWGGMVLLVLGIITRTLEYDTGLLLKAIVLAVCGVGVITAGLRFERRLRPGSSLSTPEQHP